MSFATVKSNLEKERERLLGKLRSLLNDISIDEFRSCLSSSFFDDVRFYKDELVIAESVALHEQQPTNKTCIWFKKYEEYIKLKKIISDHKKENFEEFEKDLEDFDDELEGIKVKLVVDCPLGDVKPNLRSIVRIFELVDIHMEINEDLYFYINTFLNRYKVYEELLTVKS